MDVLYKGNSPLIYRSAPSGTEYVFNPNEPVKICKDDVQFFKNLSNAPNSLWECVGLKEKIVDTVAPKKKTGAKKTSGGKK